MIPAHVVRQNDFSAGQISDSALRSDDKGLVQAALKLATNTRLRGTGPAEARPGRLAQFSQQGRTDYVRMGPDTTFLICFGNGTAVIRNTAGTVRETSAGKPWTTDTAKDVVWARVKNQIYIWYPGMKPILATWNGGVSWTFSTFAFYEDGQGKRYEPFWRYADTGITMSVSALTGNGINITFSSNVLVAGHVGTRFRYCGRQVQIASVTNGTTGTADVKEELPPQFEVTVTNGTTNGFNLGDVVEGSVSGTQGIVVDKLSGPARIVVQITKNFSGFDSTTPDYLVGPYARTAVLGQTQVANPATYPTTFWDEAACSDVRGWPQSGFADQDRLGMCDLPGIPNGIMWSAIAAYTDFLPGADPDSAMLERLNSQDRVYHVLGGPDEFVFTDRGVKYIPISESNPLKPGSVAFRSIPGAPSSSVKPMLTDEGALYVDAGRGRLVAVVPTGQTAQPYLTRDASEFHAALFNTPVCLAATTGDSDLPERYIYVVNADGTMAVGRFDIGKEWIGWVPWNGTGTVKWASGLDNELLLTTVYLPNGVTTPIVEKLSTDAYLDGQISYNSVPAELAPGVGQGPLWWYKNATVHVMDGRRYLGTRAVDANGNLVPEEGEVFTGSGIITGLNWTTTLQPFIRHAPSGQSSKQTLRRRKIKKFSVYVQNSLGFTCAGRVIPPWLQDEDEDQAGQPPLREGAYFFRVSGRAVDPVVQIVRDIPGSLRVNEIGYEVTV